MSSVVQLLRERQTDLYVSASALRTLESCPRQWWYRYPAGIPAQDTPARLILGTAVHKALALFYRCLRDGEDEPDIHRLTAIAGGAITTALASDTPNLFDDGEDGGTLVTEATRLLAAFLEQGYRPHRVLAVEEAFIVPLVHPTTGEVLPFEEQLAGAIDLLAEDEDGMVAVVDHKVSGRLDRQKAERPDIQMGIYAVAVREMLGVDDVALRYQALVRSKAAKVLVQEIQRAKGDESEAVEAAASGLALIHSAVGSRDGRRLMGRRRSWRCKDCGWRVHCAEDRA